MRRRVPLIALAVATAASLFPLSSAGARTLPGAAAPGAEAVASGAAGKPSSIAWAPCTDFPPEITGVECGTLKVPVDWDRPRGATIDLALARRKATDPAARIGSLVINPGGPGGSGVDFVGYAEGYFTEEVTRRFDIVGFDPRGVARSSPVVCSAELLRTAPYPILRSEAEFNAFRTFARKLHKDCRARTGPVFDHVDSGSVAEDIDAIRAAVGDEKLSYYGISYGTLMGQMYAEKFPRKIRSMVLDSNMDHSLGIKDFIDTEAAAAQDSFDEFVAWCEREEACALHGRDIRAFWADLLARADRGELAFPDDPDYKLTQLDVIGLAFGAFYGPAWGPLAEVLVALDTGEEPPAGELTRFLRAKAAEPVELAYLPDQVFCEDYRLPVRNYREYAEHLRRSARIAPDMRLSPPATVLTAICLGQEAPIPNPQHRLDVDGAPPLLLGNALHDPATAYPWAVNAARQIGREATLITYEGWGHGIYGRGDCPTAAIDRYLVSRNVPPNAITCPAIPPAEARTLSRPSLPQRPGPYPNLPAWGF
ncbi:alpha/beta fold hydrolase [Sphaerisporangium sp. TRM90804]|uniref:alpha/beta fold hydrolase n=1 Tax=Sphaerisporangium sp. TRM90804 TaxID=3031113 RepID=UPI002448E110|nr:alpha/beta fold hydrolase [Sphaerisporangium sp. TRM90804]MDH2427889.1 alpha/beta fold hydrolase [Sphaerisporangium sp. TRM90804]